MCYKASTSSSMIKKRKAKKTRKPARRCRTKTRKPKFLSLSLELSSEKTQESRDMRCSTSPTATSSSNDHQQLNLFPLHPENLVDDKDNHDENMAYLFSAADGGASTLTGLLGAATTSSSGEDDKNRGAELSQSASLSYVYGGEVKEASVALVRTALKNKSRDCSEEKYVRYSEVVERKDEEVTSSAADVRCGNRNPMAKVENQRLSLKLDYEVVLNAWSDKGPLYVYADSPQTVPDIHDDFLAHEFSNGLSNPGWGSLGGLWRVPVLTRSNANVHEIKKEENQQQEPPVGVGLGVGAEEWKVVQREASVLRYKEKRQNRLFSKRIRYQVRKLNAEKRPRVKGRFVKRS